MSKTATEAESEVVGLYEAEHGVPASEVYHFTNENGEPYCGKDGVFVVRSVDRGRLCPHCARDVDDMVLYGCKNLHIPAGKYHQHPPPHIYNRDLIRGPASIGEPCGLCFPRGVEHSIPDVNGTKSRALVPKNSDHAWHIDDGDGEPLCGGKYDEFEPGEPNGELCKNCLYVAGEIDFSIDEDRFFKAAKLTRNGAGSLIITVPQEIWKDASIDPKDPGSISIYYDPEAKTGKFDFRQDRRDL